MPRYLLDTNICIYIQRQKPAEVLTRFQKLKPGDAAISVITWGELLYGAEKSQQRKKALKLLEEFKTWIAAHAKAATLTIVTNNEREFQRVPGLKIQNWVG